jgi:bacterial leucyl aminopeptidase
MLRFDSATARTAAAVGALVALSGGCSEPTEPREGAPHALEARGHAPERRDDEQVWITIARDSVASVRALLGAQPAMRELSTDALADGPVALLVPRAALPEISEAQHEERDRCAGFMLHESQADAMETLGLVASPYLSFQLAPTYTLDQPKAVEMLLPALEEANVLATVRKLSSFRTRFHTSMTGQEASQWIHDAWKLLAAGRDDITVELIDHQKTPQPSIAMTIRGAVHPEQIVVLGGHMDSIAGRGDNNTVAPGADDNASGIATITEVARAALALNYRPANTVIFYGYAAEEIGLVGSAEIAAQAKADGKTVIAVLQLDMTNYTKSATPYITLISDFTDAALNDFSAKLIETYLDVPWKSDKCGYACSDHGSWTNNGFPAVAPHESTLAESNKQIHTPNDTLALTKDSVKHSMHFARFGAAFMIELAKGELGATPECSATRACEPGERCDNGVCVALPDAGTAKPAVPPAVAAGVDCTAAGVCPSGQSCVSGRCTMGAAQPVCTSDADCTGGDACAAGQCVAATGSRGVRDAGTRSADAGKRTGDAGKPTVSLADDEDERGDRDDEPAPAAGKRAAGCSLAPGARAGDLWLLLTVAVLLWPRRARRVASSLRS